jgi:hypothetical protein
MEVVVERIHHVTRLYIMQEEVEVQGHPQLVIQFGYNKELTTKYFVIKYHGV